MRLILTAWLTLISPGDETGDLLVPNPNRHYVPESSSEEDDDEDGEEAG